MPALVRLGLFWPGHRQLFGGDGAALGWINSL